MAMTKNEKNWWRHFRALRRHVEATGHFPNKHTLLCNWVKYQRRRIRDGAMPDDQLQAFTALADSRTFAHTGGRKKKCDEAAV